MNKQIFVNLAVKDLNQSKAFFESLGYSFNPQFTNDSGACMVINEDSIYANQMVAKAIAAGGKAHRQPQEHGFMYAHGFEDLDGHIWELAYMSGNPG